MTYRLLIILTLFFSMPASATWYENQNIDWWMVVYSKMQCVNLADIDINYHPVALIHRANCLYRKNNSIPNQVISISCEETLDAGFVFAISKAHCDAYVAYIQAGLKKSSLAIITRDNAIPFNQQ